MAITSNQIAKGDAVQKIIDLLAQVKKDSDLGDDEIRALFQTDELTDLDGREYIKMVESDRPDIFEPGHKYRILKSGVPQFIITATSTSDISPVFELIGESGNYGVFVTHSNSVPKLVAKELFTTGYGHGYKIGTSTAAGDGVFVVEAGVTTPTEADKIVTKKDIPAVSEITAAEVQSMFTA